MDCPGRFAWSVEFNNLTKEQVCRLDHHLGCKVAPTLVTQLEPNVVNALRLVAIRDQIGHKEIDLAAEILERASSAARVLFWNLFVSEASAHRGYDSDWLTKRVKELSPKIVSLINVVGELGPYAMGTGIRNSHPGVCPKGSITYGWHTLATPIAVSKHAFGIGTMLDVVTKTALEHGAWDITFKAGKDKDGCWNSVTRHAAIVFPCELIPAG